MKKKTTKDAVKILQKRYRTGTGEYQYKGHGIVKVKAEIVGKEIERLVEENGGSILPDVVLSAAKSKTSPLHPCFEWNDSMAAHRWRLEQASYLLRVVVVTMTPPGETKAVEVRAFPCIETDDGNYYTTASRVYASEELSENVDAQILRELKAFRTKYSNHKKFSYVWRAVDKVKI